MWSKKKTFPNGQDWQRVLNFLFYEDPPILPAHFFQIFSNPHPSQHSCFCYLVSWDECVIVPHLMMCYFTLSSLGFLISESPCYVFYVTKYQVYCRLDRDDMAFASTLIWYHTYKKINTPRTGTNRLTQKYILTLTPPTICLSQLYVLH